MRKIILILFCLSVFASCKKNNANRGSSDWQAAINGLQQGCGVLWRDSFYCTYPANHPAAGILATAKSTYISDFSMPQIVEGSLNINVGAMGLFYVGRDIQLTMNGNTASGNFSEPDASYLDHGDKIENLSAEINAQIINTNPLQILFDIKVLSGSIQGISMDNAGIHLFTKKTFYRYKPCCTFSDLSSSFNYKAVIKISLDTTGVDLYNLPDTLSAYVRQVGIPNWYYELDIQDYIGETELGGLQSYSTIDVCDKDFYDISLFRTDLLFLNSNSFFRDITDNSIRGLYRNDSLVIDHTFKARLITTDPVVLSKGVDTSRFQTFKVMGTYLKY